MPTEKQILYWNNKKGKPQSEQVKLKIGLANKGRKKPNGFSEKLRKANLGKKLSEETKNKIGLSSKGRKMNEVNRNNMRKRMKGNNYGFKKGQISLNKGKIASIELKSKLSKSHIGQKAWNKGIKGLPKHSEEHKRKISLAIKGRRHTEESKQKMRIATIEYIKRVCGYISPRIGHNEKQILDKLEQELNYKILRQYEVEGYFIDGYIEELNLAIEVDEKPKNKERDIERQKIIENKLNCKFMRIKDYD